MPFLKHVFVSVLCFCIAISGLGQQGSIHFDLPALLTAQEMLTTPAQETRSLGERNGISSKGNIWFRHFLFGEGTIELDLRGKNVFLQSFLGILFHGVDTTHYGVLYFRPFNFKHPDTARRRWSVQYMQIPENNYARLRTEHPLQYENAVSPVPNPDDWFHVKIAVTRDSLRVYIDHSDSASLQVKLLNEQHTGWFGLYADGLTGDFANLVVESPDQPVGRSINWFAGKSFDNGTIEADLRATDSVAQSFLGIAFHGQLDSALELVYFRPFNFHSSDSIHRMHAVQYMMLPNFPWDKLREQHPGQFEKSLVPTVNPLDWFHVKVVVRDGWISVFVNNSNKPALRCQKLGTLTTGRVGFWMDRIPGEIRNLRYSE